MFLKRCKNWLLRIPAFKTSSLNCLVLVFAVGLALPVPGSFNRSQTEVLWLRSRSALPQKRPSIKTEVESHLPLSSHSFSLLWSILLGHQFLNPPVTSEILWTHLTGNFGPPYSLVLHSHTFQWHIQPSAVYSQKKEKEKKSLSIPMDKR